MKEWFKRAVVAAAGSVAVAHAAAVPLEVAVGDHAYSGPAKLLHYLDGSVEWALSAGSVFDGRDTGTLGGAIGAVNVGNLSLSAITPAAYAEAHLPDTFGGEAVRVEAAASMPGDAVTWDDQTGALLQFSSAGGLHQAGSRILGTLNGGTASITNLRFDLGSATVYADLVGRSAALGSRPAADYVSLNTALWTFDAITGPAVVSPAALRGIDSQWELRNAGFAVVSGLNEVTYFSGTYTFSGLRATPAGLDFFRDSLGLLPTGINALDAVNHDPMGWGSITTTQHFAVTYIPEPSSAALMGLGLACVAAASSRRHLPGRRG